MPAQRLSSHNQSEDQFQSAVIELALFHQYDVTYHNPDSRRSQAGFPDLVLDADVWRPSDLKSGRVTKELKG